MSFSMQSQPVMAVLMLGASCGLLATLRMLLSIGTRSSDMPPGPPTSPILGNAMVVPKQKLHLQLSRWAKEYGDVISIKVFNKTIIVLGTPTVVREVLDKRSLSNSNRPGSILVDMITPNNMNMGTGHLPNATWRAMRKTAVQLLNNDNMRQLRGYQHAEATQLMWDICHEPEQWYQHIRRLTTSFAMGVLYGVRGPRSSSIDVAEFMNIHPKFMAALEFGTAPPVDIFPILKFIPEKFAKWKSNINQIRSFQEQLFDRLLSKVERRLRQGQSTGALLEEAVIHAEEWGLVDRDHLLHLGGTLLEGSDTTSASLQNAVYALTNFPEVQRKLFVEIEHVVGHQRAPEWDDLPNLPYLHAFIEECHRYRPVGPLGLPHEMSKDEFIDGYLYPKDAIIFINIWGIFHDDRYFDRPEEFIPERFLEHPLGVKQGVSDDPARRPNMLFGAGRRVCPGMALARATLEINIANLVWAFEFLPALDPHCGKANYPDMEAYAPGITATPGEFPVRIVPRSAEHIKMINDQFVAVGPVLSSFEIDISADDAEFNKTHRN